jgi:hypothetical protein
MKIDRIGKITNSQMANQFIIIQDDFENTGGYLVIQSQNLDFSGDGYDNWFESLNEVEQYIRYNNLSIGWMEEF